KHSRTGLHRHERRELDESDSERIDEDIQHRPPPDKYDHTIKAYALAVTAEGAALHSDQQINQRHQLAERDHHASDEHNERQRPRSRRVKKYYSTHDGIAIGRTERGRSEHRQNVCGDVTDRGSDDERPGVLYRVITARHELRAAARAVAQLRRVRRTRQQAAHLAGNQSRFGGGQWNGAHSSTLNQNPKSEARNSKQMRVEGRVSSVVLLPRHSSLISPDTRPSTPLP